MSRESSPRWVAAQRHIVVEAASPIFRYVRNPPVIPSAGTSNPANDGHRRTGQWDGRDGGRHHPPVQPAKYHSLVSVICTNWSPKNRNFRPNKPPILESAVAKKICRSPLKAMSRR